MKEKKPIPWGKISAAVVAIATLLTSFIAGEQKGKSDAEAPVPAAVQENLSKLVEQEVKATVPDALAPVMVEVKAVRAAAELTAKAAEASAQETKAAIDTLLGHQATANVERLELGARVRALERN